MKHAHMARLIQCGSPSCALGMGWDGITISLASGLHKAMIRGEANFIKYEVHFFHVFTLLIFSSWEQSEIITGKAIEFLFL